MFTWQSHFVCGKSVSIGLLPERVVHMISLQEYGSPLHAAVLAGHINAAKALLAAGADHARVKKVCGMIRARAF